MSSGVISSQQGRLLLRSVLRLLVADRDEDFVSARWRESQLSLEQWMDEDQVESFIVDNGLHFLRCNEIKNEVPASDSNTTGDCSNSMDEEQDYKMQADDSNHNVGRADSKDAATERSCGSRLKRIENAPRQNLNGVHADRSLQIDNVHTNESANSNAIEKDNSDVCEDENLNVTNKHASVVEHGPTDNTSDALVGMETEIDPACDPPNAELVQNVTAAVNRDDNDIDLNSDENFNRLEIHDATPSIDNESGREDEDRLRGLENNELEPSCSEDLNELDRFSSESDAVEERNELCLEERLLALMEAGERGDRVLEWLEQLHRSRRPDDKSVVARALTRALCRYALAGSRRAPDDQVDEVRLQRYQDLLKSFSSNHQHGLDCVIGVQDLMQRKPQHNEALLSILQHLLEEDFVPLDALQAYEQFVNAQSLN